MRNSTLALTLFALAASGVSLGVAQAGDETTAVKAERVVYLCDSSEITQRSFERQFGEQVFVTAEQALKAAREQEVWAAPRCMTPAEHARLEVAMAERAQTILLTARD